MDSRRIWDFEQGGPDFYINLELGEIARQEPVI
jgi:hypothetical protein